MIKYFGPKKNWSKRETIGLFCKFPAAKRLQSAEINSNSEFLRNVSAAIATFDELTMT